MCGYQRRKRKKEVKKKSCRGLQGKCEFLILPWYFLFIITVSDNRVPQVLMDLFLSHPALRLLGHPREAETEISKEPVATRSSWTAARISKSN